VCVAGAVALLLVLNMLNKTTRILIRSLTIFFSSSLAICFSVYWGIPFFLKRGLRFGDAYLFCFYFPFVCLLGLALWLYHREGHTWTWPAFSRRFRLKKLTKADVFWTLGLILFALVGYGIMTQTLGVFLIKHVPFLEPPEYFPGGLNPNKPMVPGEFFGIPLKGQWWVACVYFIGWFFNIFGEELMFRGFLLPKEETILGKYAWVYQGIIWALWHSFWKWNVIPLLVVTLPLVFVVQRQKNTWIGIIAHGVLNLIPLVAIIGAIL
jgi:membrane protease YdiL (CAAX protease family)